MVSRHRGISMPGTGEVRGGRCDIRQSRTVLLVFDLGFRFDFTGSIPTWTIPSCSIPLR